VEADRRQIAGRDGGGRSLDKPVPDDYPRPMFPASLPEAGVSRAGITESASSFGTRTASTATEMAMGTLPARAP
jgi:hypothetical protein